MHSHLFTPMPACFSDLYYYTTMDYEDDPDEADEGGGCYVKEELCLLTAW